MSHVGTLPNLDRSKVGSRNSYRPLLIVRASYKCPEIQSDLETCCSQIYSKRDRLFADDIDVIDYCSVFSLFRGHTGTKTDSSGFDVHEPFLKVKKWN